MRRNRSTETSSRAARKFPKPIRVFSLEFGLGRLDGRHEEVAHITGRLVEVVAHLVAALALGDDVEVEAVQSVSYCP